MINQIAIIIFSCASVWLFSTKKHFRFGFVAGLIGQPFWIYSAVTTEQWGILVVAIWFSASHVRGIYNHFRMKNELDGGK